MPWLRPNQLDGASLLGLGLGLYWFYDGFQKLKLKRLMGAVATSKVRSLAMGMVELSGFAGAGERPLNDPIYGLPCVYFDICVKEQHGSGKSSSWVKIYENKSPFPFYLTDDTGQVLVYPGGATCYFDKDISLNSNAVQRLFSGTDDAVSKFIGRLNCGSLASLSIQAHFVREYEPLYVLGYAAPDETQIPPDTDLSDVGLARLLKADPKRMRALDKNGDGAVDGQEWEEGLRQFKAEMEKARRDAPRPEPPIVIRKSPDGLLILADKAENALTSKLGILSTLEVLGGPLLALGSAAYLASLFFGG